ncbi:hypothetical protein ACIRYZ_25525 [Kitasatospora sp. NPDC101155]|uniref:hypothetical protein n=1 Tax=Kitasatospora sp. NPDC101155 TaxID=3364097 RepID=UPI00382B6021
MTTQATQFTLETVDGSGIVLGQSFLTLDGNGEPAIAYLSGPATEASVIVARRHNGQWTLDNTGGRGTPDNTRVGLGFDSSNVPHIAYRDGGTDNGIFGTKTNDEWSFEEIPTQGGIIARGVADVSLQIEPNLHDPPFADTPTVGYRDAFQGDSVAVARKVGASWQISGVDGASATRNGLSLAFDSSANLRVAYFQGFDDGTAVIPEPLKLGAEVPSDVTDTAPPTFVSQVIDKDVHAAAGVSMARGLFATQLVAYADHQVGIVHAWVNEGVGLPPSIEVVAPANGGAGPRHPSAAGSPHQLLFVTYLDGGQVMLAERAPDGEWNSRPVAPGDGWPSLAFGKDGTAHLAYGTGKLMYARAPIDPV